MRERGQTQIDFLIGMSVFLLAVAFTFGFVPTMIAPFDDTSGSDLMVADRSAAHLAENALGSESSEDAPERPGMLNETEVEEFFGDPDLDLESELGLPNHTQVNVTISENGEQPRYRAGSEPPSDRNIAVSTRIVSIDGPPHELRVKVW